MHTNKKKGKTHIEKQREKAEAVNQALKNILGLSEYKYNLWQIEIALRFVSNYHLTDDLQKAVIESKLFWGWWKNLWNKRNACFLEVIAEQATEISNEGLEASEELSLHDLLEEYFDYNTFKNINSDFVKKSFINLTSKCLEEAKKEAKNN